MILLMNHLLRAVIVTVDHDSNAVIELIFEIFLLDQQREPTFVKLLVEKMSKLLDYK